MKPWENPYFEEDYENSDCDCYGCATMRHECWYDYIKRKEKFTKVIIISLHLIPLKEEIFI